MLSDLNLQKKSTVLLAGAVLCIILLTASFTHASWSDQFNLSGLNGTVRAIAKGSGNDVYVGGEFITAGKNIVNYIAKWDGASWSSLGSGMNRYVYALAYDSASDTLYAGGVFTTAGDTVVNYIAKWDGTSWSALGAGMNSTVSTLAYSSVSNTLYAGGYFTTAGGYAANYIAKWNGTSWSPLGAGMNGGVSTLAYSSFSNTLYAGGYFTTAGGYAANYTAKWNGTSWSALGAGMNNSVGVLVYDSASNTLYAGGYFATAGGVPANSIAKWNGTTWNALGSGVNDRVHALVYDSATHTLYAGGRFKAAGGSPTSYIAKWNGTSWSALGAGMNNDVYALMHDSVSHTLYAGGNFTTADSAVADYFAKWNSGTWSSQEIAAGNGIAGYVNTLVYDAAGNLYVGGYFTSVGDIPANNIAKWDGTSWSALGAGMNDSVGVLVYDSASNTLYAGGTFTTAGGSAAKRIAKWDGTSWSDLGSGMNNNVYALAYDSVSNILYAGGNFTTAGGSAAKRIAKWDGTSWSALGSGMDNYVNGLTYDSVSHTLYAGGCFTTAGGIAVNYIAKWDGTSWSPLGAGVDGYVSELMYDSASNSLYAGGTFTTAGGFDAKRIAKWNGTTWSALGSGGYDMSNNYVNAIAYDSGSNTLYVGGNFATAGDSSANRIAKWDGTSWSSLGMGTNSTVNALAYNSASDTLYAGGNFAVVDGTIISNCIGLWTPPPKISSVSSPAADGTYGTGSVIPITVTFSKPVIVTGIPQLSLETGTSDAVVDYTSGSGTSVLTFNYTVAAGHISDDLDYISAAALSLNGGTVKSLSGTDDAVLTLPAPGEADSLGANKAIVIDGTAPAISSVTSGTADGSYYQEDTVEITVNFSEAVTLAGGNLTVNLDSGGSVTIAPFGPASSASGTYTVAAGHNSADLDSVSISLAGGATLKDTAGNDAVLTIPPGQSLRDSKAIVVITAPVAPSGLTASAVSQIQINLSWTDNSSNETGFRIFRNSSLIATTAADATSFGDSGLTCGTAYTYTVKAANAGGDSSGVTATATTSACPPVTAGVSMVSVSNVKATTAIATGYSGESGATERGFFWWNDDKYWGDNASGLIPAGGSGAGDFSLTLTGLPMNTQLYVAAYVKIGDQIITSGPGNFISITTTGPVLPTVITKSDFTVSGNEVLAKGGITDVGSSSVTIYGFVYAKHTSPTVWDMALPFTWDNTLPISQGKAFEGTIRNFSAGTYYFRSYARNAQGTAYGEEFSFTISGGDCTGGVPGDLNGDGIADLTDILIALKILDDVPVSSQNLKGDVNGDCKIGLEEAIFVLQTTAGVR